MSGLFQKNFFEESISKTLSEKGINQFYESLLVTVNSQPEQKEQNSMKYKNGQPKFCIQLLNFILNLFKTFSSKENNNFILNRFFELYTDKESSMQLLLQEKFDKVKFNFFRMNEELNFSAFKYFYF